jgi:hypothetical protein
VCETRRGSPQGQIQKFEFKIYEIYEKYFIYFINSNVICRYLNVDLHNSIKFGTYFWREKCDPVA